MHLLALAHRSGGNYMASTSVEAVTCPRCGCEMRVEDIISGKYDYHTGAIGGIFQILIFIALVVGIVYFVRSCS